MPLRMSTATRDKTARLPAMTRVVIETKNRRQRHSGLILALATLFLSGAAAAVDFKGIEMGQTLWGTEELSVFGVLDCNPMQLDPDEYQSYIQELQQVIPGGRKVCTGATSIATIPADATVVLGAARRVLRMTFQFAAENYAQVLNAMTEKWGEGLVEVHAEDDESVWWEFDDGASISVHHTPLANQSSSGDNPASIGLVEYSLAVATPAGDL